MLKNEYKKSAWPLRLCGFLFSVEGWRNAERFFKGIGEIIRNEKAAGVGNIGNAHIGLLQKMLCFFYSESVDVA